jgi:hypothetical protein
MNQRKLERIILDLEDLLDNCDYDAKEQLEPVIDTLKQMYIRDPIR